MKLGSLEFIELCESNWFEARCKRSLNVFGVFAICGEKHLKGALP